jgi:hypothetical protein
VAGSIVTQKSAATRLASEGGAAPPSH